MDQGNNEIAKITEDSSNADVLYHGFIAGSSYLTGGAVEAGNFVANIITSTSLFSDETRARANSELDEAFGTFDNLNNNKAAVASNLVNTVGTNIGEAAAGSQVARGKVLAGGLSLLGGGQGLAGKSGAVTQGLRSSGTAVANVTKAVVKSKAVITATKTFEKGVITGGNRIAAASKSAAAGVKESARVVAQKSKHLANQHSRNMAATSIRSFRKDMKGLGYNFKDVNSYVKAFETASFRYSKNLNPFKSFYRHYNAGERMGGPWIHDTKSLLTASPYKRKIDLALPASSTATASAKTTLPLFRKAASGNVAHQSPLFTGLPGLLKTGGPKQWFVPSKPEAGLPYLEFSPVK